jgi:hypothetical protein
MYRESPDNESDSGWRFMAGDESDEYMDDADNHAVYSLNTIANYDADIIPLLQASVGTAFAREGKGDALEPVDSPVDADGLSADFPVVEGDYQLNSTWAMTLPEMFNRRIDDGDLVLWRPGLTIYCAAWDNDGGVATDERWKILTEAVSAEATEAQESQRDGLRTYSYRLTEDGVEGLHGFILSEDGHLQLSIYFDDPADLQTARTCFASVVERPE